MRSSHKFHVWQHHTEDIHPMTENMLKHSHTHAHTQTFTHTHTHSRTTQNEETCPYSEDGTSHQLQKECSYCFKERQKKNLCTVYQLRSPSWSPSETFWQYRNDTWEHIILRRSFKEKWGYRIHKKTRWYNGFWDEKAVCCMDASAQEQAGQWWWWRWWFVPPPTPPAHPFKRVRLASMLLFRLVTFYVYAEGLSRSKLSEEYTHKYCLFLACLQAARVWSLLKSPESDSKISSIRIPALDLHMSLIVVMTHMLLRCVGVFFFFVYLSTDIIGECSKVDCIQYAVIVRTCWWRYKLTDVRIYSQLTRCALLE